MKLKISTSFILATAILLSGAGVAEAAEDFTKPRGILTAASPAVSQKKSVIETTSQIVQETSKVIPQGVKIEGSTSLQGVVPGLENGMSRGVAGVSAEDRLNSTSADLGATQSLMTLLHEGDSEARFHLAIPDGQKAEISSSGAVDLRGKNGVIPFIKAPWAVDASGKKLKTTYSIVDNVLIQRVDVSGAKYPIVADPSIQWKPFPYLALYGAQADIVARSIQTIALALGAGGCALASKRVGGWLGAAVGIACGAVGFNKTGEVMKKIVQVWRSHGSKNSRTCYGFKLIGPGRPVITLPARDCSWK